MSGFRFRLQSVLDWRAAQLEAEEMRLRQLLEAGGRLESAIAEAETARAGAEASVRRSGAVTAAELWALAAYREAAREQARRLEEERSRHEALVRAQRERIAAARQRSRLLERLRERRLTEWNAEDQRQLEECAAEAYLARWRPR